MKYIFSAIFLYLFFGLMLFVFQRRIVFNKSGHPGKPNDYNLLTTEEIQILTEDNINPEINKVTLFKNFLIVFLLKVLIIK